MVKEPAWRVIEVPCALCRKDFMMKMTEFLGRIAGFPRTTGHYEKNWVKYGILDLSSEWGKRDAESNKNSDRPVPVDTRRAAVQRTCCSLSPSLNQVSDREKIGKNLISGPPDPFGKQMRSFKMIPTVRLKKITREFCSRPILCSSLPEVIHLFCPLRSLSSFSLKGRG
jgi:hypothetical protein